MKYPESIKKSGTIGFVAPSFGCATEPYKTAFNASHKFWRDRGYNIELGPNCYASDGIGISSTPQSCALEITDGYCSDTSDVLISCGGGELMCEILPYVDFERIANANPKWYMGYSDNTNFTFTLTTKCDVATIYGPCASNYGSTILHPALLDAASVFEGAGRTQSPDGIEEVCFEGYGLWEKEGLRDEEHPLMGYNPTEKTILKMYECSEGKGGIYHSDKKEYSVKQTETVNMQGRLIGGCLDVLAGLCGTQFDYVSQYNERYKEDGIIWYLEACDLNVLSIRRAIWELENAGWFDCAAGFVIGRPLRFGETIMGLDQYRAVLDVIAHHKVPVLMDADLGHLPPMVPMINGSYAYVSADSDNWNIRMQLR